MPVLKLTDEDPADTGLIAQVFLGHPALVPKGLHPVSEARSSVTLHSPKNACIPSDTTLPIGYTGIVGSTDCMPQNDRKRVPLTKAQQLAIFVRDRWLCQWCNKPVIFAPAMKYLQLQLRAGGFASPAAYYHAHWTRATSPLLDELGAVLDHRTAFMLGGECTPDNFVTACNKCNGRKNAQSIDEWNKRSKRKAIKGKYGDPEVWDGLSNLFVVLAAQHSRSVTAGERAWIRAIERVTHNEAA